MTAPATIKGCSPYSLARLVVERAESELVASRAGVPERVGVVPDKPPFEFCAQLWALVTGIGPRPAQSQRAATAAACGPEWRVTVTVGVYRCEPVTNKNRPQDAPSVVALDSGARDLLDDAEALRRAILGADWDLIDVDRAAVTIGQMRTVGRSGGGFGVEWDLIVDTELGRFTDEAVPKLPGDPRKD
ncbi:hypothetical protein SEA_DEXDERT_26 [Gordonia phage Dexdert]|uniref:Uncharacterized protein n=1 Tax=Gordonia phage Dexdert TaxID=2794946 RepID=A0A7T1KS35_9CAUD|nr:hypothetical protein J1597_gp26 [Gordonia phage Dexdert]QPO17023.1 hypothetical protein SEA_DEXDERT_26 [Gordonia phage Dexdert]